MVRVMVRVEVVTAALQDKVNTPVKETVFFFATKLSSVPKMAN